MRRTLPLLASLAILAVIATAGVHCAHADASPGHPSGPHSVLERWPLASPAPSIELVDDTMLRLPVFAHDGRRYVLGETGNRYWVRIANPTPTRVEAVVSVDGLDAINGHPANLGKRGYIVPAYSEVTIDGWRTSLDTVAAFRFSSVRDSYAARTGHDRNVGVIGVAFFRERPPPAVAWRPPPPLQPAPTRQRSAAAEDTEGAADRPGLGTQFGESQESRVVETAFVRADSSPVAVAELRYDDHEGLVSRGIAIPPLPTVRDEENELRNGAQAFPDARFAQPPR